MEVLVDGEKKQRRRLVLASLFMEMRPRSGERGYCVEFGY